MSSACRRRPRQAAPAFRKLRPKLSALYQRIREEAPDADVMVMGYPRFFRTSPSVTGSTALAGFDFMQSDMVWLNSVAVQVNRGMKSAARTKHLIYVYAYHAWNGDEFRTSVPYF